MIIIEYEDKCGFVENLKTNKLKKFKNNAVMTDNLKQYTDKQK